MTWRKLAFIAFVVAPGSLLVGSFSFWALFRVLESAEGWMGFSSGALVPGLWIGITLIAIAWAVRSLLRPRPSN